MNLDSKRLSSREISPLIDLAGQESGPFFVYRTDSIKKQYARLKRAFSQLPVHIHYACKALSNLEILRFIRSLGCGLDAVSLQEVKLGIEAGYATQDILFTPNGAAWEEMEEAIKLGVRINVDAISTLEKMGEYYSDTPICIRVNPHIMAGGNSKISVGHIDSKFGISIHQMPHVHKLVDSWGLNVEALHMHTGSDILDAEVFLRAADILLNAAMEFPNLRYIDMGSGFKVAYKEGDLQTDIERLGELITERMLRFYSEYGKEVQLVFEPGKFLVSEAGLFLTQVTNVKITPSTMFASVNTGFNHLIRPMFYDAYHHIENLSNPEGQTRIYNVVGYLCETDTFAVNRRIASISEGDTLCFYNAGAYCYSMASNYNSRFRPAEYLWHEEKLYCIREAEDFEDLIRLQKSTGLFV